MALQKAIKQDNGVVLNYHRISDITNTVHHDTSIDIISYVDEESRNTELNNPKYSPNKINVYMVRSSEKVDYNDTLTITDAYNYLKTTEKYSGATDV